MKQVEFWRWSYADPEDGTLKVTRYRMDRKEAQKRFPGALAVPGSLEMRSLPESADDRNAARRETGSSVGPNRRAEWEGLGPRR